MNHLRKILVLFLALLCLTSLASAESMETMKLTEDQYYAMNLFLSNFTEIGIDEVAAYAEDEILVDFAHDHMWFNSYDSFEYGEYEGENNCRVADDRIQEIVDSYFYYAPTVDLSRTRFDYDGDYYYHCETGGWTNDGFALTASVTPLSNDQYYVAFMSFGSGAFWENDVLRMTFTEAWEEFDAPTGYGHAVLYASDLADRSTYKMISYNG